MVKIELIKKRISNIIQKEWDITQKELREIEEKVKDNIYLYGFNGHYIQLEKARQRREDHLEELKALRRNQEKVVQTKKVRMYPYYCPDCQAKIYIPHESNRRENLVTCPYCERPIYPSCEYEEWEEVKGSRTGKIRNGFIAIEEELENAKE